MTLLKTFIKVSRMLQNRLEIKKGNLGCLEITFDSRYLKMILKGIRKNKMYCEESLDDIKQYYKTKKD